VWVATWLVNSQRLAARLSGRGDDDVERISAFVVGDCGGLALQRMSVARKGVAAMQRTWLMACWARGRSLS